MRGAIVLAGLEAILFVLHYLSRKGSKIRLLLKIALYVVAAALFAQVLFFCIVIPFYDLG